MESEFIKDLFSGVSHLIKPHWEIDHICYRTNSLEEYEEVKSRYDSLGELLIESPIGGRPIATFELNKAIKSLHGYTKLVEVPAPKTGKTTESGYEHIEVVIDDTFEELIKKDPNISWDDRALKKSLNPELEAQFGKVNIKFHYHALDCIIALEKKQVALAFIKELSSFSDYSPLVSGTIPLGIDIKSSDLDVLMVTNDFDQLAAKINIEFPAAKIQIRENNLVANFTYQNLPIEIYAEEKHPLRQKAHRHLRVENRIIKLLGKDFKQRIIQHKMDGLKTEPAFGKELNLKNSYDDLLEMYFLSDHELLERIRV